MTTMEFTGASGSVIVVNCEEFTLDTLAEAYPDTFGEAALQRLQDSICRGIGAMIAPPPWVRSLRALAELDQLLGISERLKQPPAAMIEFTEIEWSLKAFTRPFPVEWTPPITVPAPTWRPSPGILSLALAYPERGML